jgi:hypothetical protein
VLRVKLHSQQSFPSEHSEFLYGVSNFHIFFISD